MTNKTKMAKAMLALAFLVSMATVAQDQKWSIETNYAIIPSDGAGGDDDILDLGLKYRFADLEFMQLGVGANAGFSWNNYNDNDMIEGSDNAFYFQPRVFAEFLVPGIQKLRPRVGLGYSIVNNDTDVISIGEEIKMNTTNGGFNFNLGMSYDITKRFFIQAQYDFINLRVTDSFMFQGELVEPDDTTSLNSLRLGLGFRF